LAVVAVAPGASAPADGPAERGSLDDMFGPRTAGTPPEARVTTINLSGDAVASAEPGTRVPLRHIVGARASTGRWLARGRRTMRVGGWLAGTATVGVGLFTLWVLLFSTISGGDVWLGRPLEKPASRDQQVQNAVDPPVSSVAPTSAAPPSTTPAGSGAPKPTSGKSSGTSGTSGSGSGRNGADDPPGDDAGGARATAPATGATPGGGSGRGSGSGGSGSGGGSGSSGGSSGGGHGTGG
jgi:hypothetical protein